LPVQESAVYGESQQRQYVRAVYFIIATIATVGHGDIVPLNNSYC